MCVCMCLQKAAALLDGRSLNLSGEPTWIRSGLEIFSRSSTMTSYDWMQIMQSAGDYILADIVEDVRRREALYALVEACRGCYTLLSPDGVDDRHKIIALKIQVAEALSLCELVLPKTELSVMFHILLHVPDAMFRWNAVRNFWGFFGERMMGYLIRHIHNRDLACENIMTGYVRLRYILKAYPQTINKMCHRFDHFDMRLPRGGNTLMLAEEVCKSYRFAHLRVLILAHVLIGLPSFLLY